MNKKIITSIVCLLICLGISNQLLAQEDWNQFKGKDRTGISAEKLEGTDIQPKLLWKKELGPGFSEILISGNIAYTLYGDKHDSLTGVEYLVAMDAKTGKELWKSVIDSLYIELDKWGDGPRSTPIYDDETIYCFSGKGLLSARSKKDGSLKWEINFVTEYGSTRPRWGYASSPLLVDDKLIIEAGGTEGRAMIALNKNDGSLIWSNGTGVSGYNSPRVFTIDGEEQILSIISRVIQSFSFDGDTLWTVRSPIGGVTAIPIQYDENKFFFSNAGRYMFAEIKDRKLEMKSNARTMNNDYSSSVYYEGHLYGFHTAALRCIDANTGAIKWSKRGFGKGSLSMVDGKLLVLADKGKLAVVNANPNAYEELALVNAIKGSHSWTAPSYSDGCVYVRNQTEIACFQLK